MSENSDPRACLAGEQHWQLPELGSVERDAKKNETTKDTKSTKKTCRTATTPSELAWWVSETGTSLVGEQAQN